MRKSLSTPGTNGHRWIVSIAGIMLSLACAATLSACGSSTKVEARTTTIGQELKDLDDARNKGLLTEDEYSKKRDEIMKRK